MIEPSHLPLLARCLTGPVLREFYKTGRTSFLRAAFNETGVHRVLGEYSTLMDALRTIFKSMQRSYRSDYVYRSAIASKLFLGRHSPSTTTLLSELRIWRCKADVVLLNGTSTVYEIKTERDNLDRLSQQIATYSRMFDRIFVVTYERQLERVQRLVPNHVGIIILTPTFTLRTCRDALSNAENIEATTVVDALRQSEVLELTRQICHTAPTTSSVHLVQECSRLLEEASPDPRSVHTAMVTILKQRRTWSKWDFLRVPVELLPGYLESGISREGWSALTERLTTARLRDIVC